MTALCQEATPHCNGAVYTQNPAVKAAANGRITMISGRTYCYGKPGLVMSNMSLDLPGSCLIELPSAQRPRTLA